MADKTPVGPIAEMIAQSSTDVDAALDELYKRDATMLAVRRLAAMQGWSDMEMFKRMAILLAHEKQQYLDMSVRYMETIAFNGNGIGWSL